MATGGESIPEVSPAIALVVKSCNTKWEELKKTFADIQTGSMSSIADTLPADDNGDEPTTKILQEKERSLKAELAAVKAAKPRVLPPDREVLVTALEEDLHKTERELQALSSLLDGMLVDLDARTAREQKNATEFLAVNQCLREEAEMVEQQTARDPLADIHQELTESIKVAEKRHRDLMQELVKFVGEHYPLPSQPDLAKVKKTLRHQRQWSLTNLLPLKDILQELMNKCVDEPDDPYVILDDRYWPPYIEVLLRCNLALRHPDDSQRIKMVPFHL